MLSAPSPMALPGSSSPPGCKKRPIPCEPEEAAAKPIPRIRAPFLVPDDESEDENDSQARPEHVAKKRLLRCDGERPPTTSNAPDPEPGSVLGCRLRGPQMTSSAGVGDPGQDFPSHFHPPPADSIWSHQRPLFSSAILNSICPPSYSSRNCSGKTCTIRERRTRAAPSYESMVAARSVSREGRAKRSYYGVDIHRLLANEDSNNPEDSGRAPNDTQAANECLPSIDSRPAAGGQGGESLLWTEKYRARTFVDLCGDDGTNRQVLRWLKRWDSLVFPGQAKAKSTIAGRRPGFKPQTEDERPHKKILLLTGPPGLGKTTLAHVCARQAGYEVLEINASDDRSRDVVKNRIRTSLGTESVKTVTRSGDTTGKAGRGVARPICVVVDEVDGVTTGSGPTGEGSFVRALIDLILMDQRNAAATNHVGAGEDSGRRRKKKGDDFRQMRPLILICNDVYHPSLRPLRQSNLADIIHAGRPTMDAVVGRLRTIFQKEGIPSEKEAVRKLCETTWGVATGIDARRGVESTVEGDLRGILVVGEWVAGRFRASCKTSDVNGSNGVLTRQWVEHNILQDMASGVAGARGLGRGSVRDIVNRLFQEGGGFPKQGAAQLSDASDRHEQPQAELGFGEQRKKLAMERLGHMMEASGDISAIVTDIFSEYPLRDFNDDGYLSKPNQAYDWLHFHDACQSRLYSNQDWDLMPYLGQPVLACHHLFASSRGQPYGGSGSGAFGDRRRAAGAADGEADGPPMPFTGPRADYQAREAEKQNRAQLQALQAQLSPSLMRSFRSPEDVATGFLPYLVRMVSPNVKPVVVGGSQDFTATVRKESERALVRRASEILAEVGIALHRGKIETESLPGRGPQYVYRMDP